MTVTETLPDRFVRLPVWYQMGSAAEIAGDALLQSLSSKAIA